MPLLLLIAEVMLIYYFVQAFGLLDMIFFYIVTSFLGILILRIAGSKSIRQFQTGQITPGNNAMLSQGLLFLSGLLTLVPSMATKILGIFLLIPPVRWLVAFAFTSFLMKRIFNSSSFIHQFGNSGGFRFYYNGKSNPFQDPDFNSETPADDNVIDAKFRKVDETKLIK